MKIKTGILGAILVGLLGYSGYLYNDGYFSSWEDLKPELKQFVYNQLKASNQDIPDEVVMGVSECFSTELARIADAHGCRTRKDVREAWNSCAEENPSMGVTASQAIQVCVMRVMMGGQ